MSVSPEGAVCLLRLEVPPLTNNKRHKDLSLLAYL